MELHFRAEIVDTRGPEPAAAAAAPSPLVGLFCGDLGCGAGGGADGGADGGAGAGAGAPRTISFAEGEEAMTRI